MMARRVAEANYPRCAGQITGRRVHDRRCYKDISGVLGLRVTLQRFRVPSLGIVCADGCFLIGGCARWRWVKVERSEGHSITIR
jgi:hypothetical protein